MARTLRVLFVEDRQEDVDLLVVELRRGGFDLVQERVDTPEGFAAALALQEWDVVLCDFEMPHFSAAAALAMVKEQKADLPFIVVSGTIGEESAVESLRAGAHDFMTKDRLFRLLPALDRELRDAASREDLRSLEQQYQQSQRVEAIGHFAGGIAHDFNNLLSVITGYVDMALATLGADEPVRRHLEEVRKASGQAATLVRQILSFSRPHIVDRRFLDLNSAMTSMDSLLRRVIGKDMDFRMALAPHLCPVRADPGQMEQILMNLVVNARDAMPNGGSVVVETAALELRADDAHCRFGLQPGPHVLLSVTDTGIGMDERTRARIFEPFFTTKGEGKGTGIGLATVHSIVKQSGGAVFVHSEPGRGSRFQVYFPCARKEPEAPGRLEPRGGVAGGKKTVLVVENDDAARRIAVEVLRGSGYRVLEASSAAGALALGEGEKGAIDLLVTDVVMPGMSGAELAGRFSFLRRGMRVLLMSGHAAGVAGLQRPSAEKTHGLLKPFLPDDLLRRVREVLDGSLYPAVSFAVPANT